MPPPLPPVRRPASPQADAAAIASLCLAGLSALFYPLGMSFMWAAWLPILPLSCTGLVLGCLSSKSQVRCLGVCINAALLIQTTALSALILFLMAAATPARF